MEIIASEAVARIQNSTWLSFGTSGTLCLGEKRFWHRKCSHGLVKEERAPVPSRQLLTHMVPKRGWEGEGREQAAGTSSTESIRANLKERIIKRCGDKCENITKRQQGSLEVNVAEQWDLSVQPTLVLNQRNSVELIYLNCRKMLGSRLWGTWGGKPERMNRWITGG